MASPEEKIAIVSIFARYISTVDQNKADEAIKREAEDRIRKHALVLNDCHAGLRLFGYRISEEKDALERMKADIGIENWNRAFDIARPSEKKRAETGPAPAADDSESSGQQPAPAESTQPDAADDSNEAMQLAAGAEDGAAPEVPRVREVVLEQLRLAGSSGSKATPLREYLEKTYSLKLHEKTIGMTLYRLQKAGLVRREGLMWFLSPPKADGENPGAGAPGPINEAT